MGILDSIKGTRKLSFNFWRYRLLHWCFNVKDPNPDCLFETGLPKFLYTHYCPLFHLTNLIAIFSPIILFIKILCVIIGATIAGVKAIPWGKIENFLGRFMPKPDPNAQESCLISMSAGTATRESERLAAINLIYEFFECRSKDSFDDFWKVKSYKFTILTKEEVQVIFDEYSSKIKEAQERARKRKEARQASFIFWTNFSRVFVKCFLNVFYVALAIVMVYVSYLMAKPLWSLVCWMVGGIYDIFTSKQSLDTLIYFIVAISATAFVSLILILLVKIGFLRAFGIGLRRGLSKLSPPLYIVGRFFRWIGNGFKSTCEFIRMFYEENCPPIVLVSPEEEKIEEIAQGIAEANVTSEDEVVPEIEGEVVPGDKTGNKKEGE